MSLPTHKPVDTMQRRDTTTRKRKDNTQKEATRVNYQLRQPA